MPSELVMPAPNKVLVAAFQSLEYSSFKDVNVLCASDVPFFIFVTEKENQIKNRSGASKKSIFNVRPITDMRCGQSNFHLTGHRIMVHRNINGCTVENVIPADEDRGYSLPLSAYSSLQCSTWAPVLSHHRTYAKVINFELHTE